MKGWMNPKRLSWWKEWEMAEGQEGQEGEGGADGVEDEDGLGEDARTAVPSARLHCLTPRVPDDVESS